MPTYEYVCTKCGHEFEIFQSMKDAPLKNGCPVCRRGRVKRKIGGGGGLIFKGSGFYETDYKRKSALKTDGKAEDLSTKPIAGSKSPNASKPSASTI